MSSQQQAAFGDTLREAVFVLANMTDKGTPAQLQHLVDMVDASSTPPFVTSPVQGVLGRFCALLVAGTEDRTAQPAVEGLHAHTACIDHTAQPFGTLSRGTSCGWMR